MFVIGGFDGTEYFNSCRTFHLRDRVWNDIAPMNERRCYVSVAYLDGLLYAMGGFNGHIRQNTAEKYLIESNQWSAICPMHVQRSDASACTLNGRTFNARLSLSVFAVLLRSSVYLWRFRWTRMFAYSRILQSCYQSMDSHSADAQSTERRGSVSSVQCTSSSNGVAAASGVIAYRGSVYAIGGFNGATRLSTGERYNPSVNTWRPISDMFHPRSNFAIEVDSYRGGCLPSSYLSLGSR